MIGLGILPLVIILIAIAYASRASQRQPSPFRLVARTTPGEAFCGKCGYAVRPGHGTNIERCPECGQLYAEAGLITPALAARFGPSLANILANYATLTLLASALVGGIVSAIAYNASESSGLLSPELIATLAGLATATPVLAFGTWRAVVYMRRIKFLTGEYNPRLPQNLRR